MLKWATPVSIDLELSAILTRDLLAEQSFELPPPIATMTEQESIVCFFRTPKANPNPVPVFNRFTLLTK